MYNSVPIKVYFHHDKEIILSVFAGVLRKIELSIKIINGMPVAKLKKKDVSTLCSELMGAGRRSDRISGRCERQAHVWPCIRDRRMLYCLVCGSAPVVFPFSLLCFGHGFTLIDFKLIKDGIIHITE